MTYLFVHVACVLCFSQLLRLGQKRSCRTVSVAGVNYVLTAVLSAGLLLAFGAWRVAGPGLAAGLGAVNGVLFLLHLLVMVAGFRLAGVGITWAFVSSGVVLPVLVTHFAWGEHMSRPQWIALGLVPVAVVLLRPRGKKEAGQDGAKRLGLRGDGILLLCFVMAGAMGTIHKAQEFYTKLLLAGPGGELDEAGELLARNTRLFYQAVLFGVSCLCSIGYMALKRIKPTVREFKIGGGVGAVNTFGLFFALLALSALPATVFFPTAACLIIILNTALGRALWREKITRRQVAGVGLALAVVVLSNLGGEKPEAKGSAPGTEQRAPGLPGGPQRIQVPSFASRFWPTRHTSAKTIPTAMPPRCPRLETCPIPSVWSQAPSIWRPPYRMSRAMAGRRSHQK